MRRILAFLLVALALSAGSPAARADSNTERRLDESTRVFESFSNLSEQAIPAWLLERAYGVVVVPNVIRGALIIGGRGGAGVMAVRNADGSWSNPVFVKLGGASIGFQWGLQSTDLVLMSRKSVEGIAGGKVTLGADASVAAGPIGRSASAATDAASYAVPGILASQILEGTAGQPTDAAIAFSAALAKATSNAATSTAPASTATTPASATRPPGPRDDEARVFPLEDPAAGAPPPE